MNDAVLMDPLQIALIALLPKSGEGRTVAELARAAAITPERVTAALFDPYMAGKVDFDVRTDTYRLPRPAEAAQAQHHVSTSERKEA
jgi:hypothetical protein